MCGIAGKYSSFPDPEARANITRALDSLKHRGPDGQHSIIENRNGGTSILGHRRLAIIDLSQEGLQPMTGCDGRYTITFNGEIYNYRELRNKLQQHAVEFHTDTDTEVLLKSWAFWGPECLDYITGMFAFVIEDKKNNTFDCVRDAFGIKPFFYKADSKSFTFASEVEALRILSSEKLTANPQRAFDYLSLGRYDNRAATFFNDVYHLEPGCRLTIQLGDEIKLSKYRWWNPSIKEQEGLSFDQAVEEVRTTYLESIKLHLRSDVPLGAALSGGLDSSAIVCAMRHIYPDMDIHTFSYIADNGATNEESWADIVNTHVGAISHKVSIEEGDLLRDMDDLIISHGEPFGSTSIYAGYRIFKAVRDASITVCLEGQGADELLAGYHGYPYARMLSMLERGQFFEMKKFLAEWSNWPGRDRTNALQSLVSELVPHKMQSTAMRLVGRNVLKPWLKVDALENAGVKLERNRFTIRTREGRQRRLVEMLRSLTSGTGLSHLLRHGDRNAMRWSIESRVPFLSPDFAKLALSLPENYLISNRGETKSVFRAAMRGIVPDSVINRRDKVGFETPELKWLGTGELKIDDILEVANEVDFLDIDHLKVEVKAILDQEKPFTWQAWRIINYCKWLRLVLLK